MSGEKLRLEVILAAVDKVTGTLKTITKGSGDAARALGAAKAQLKGIEGQRRLIADFKEADKTAAITANAFKGMQDRVRQLKEEMAKTPEPTQKMVKALKDAEAESKKLKGTHEKLMSKQQRLFQEMRAGGIDVNNLADHSRDLATRQIEAAKATDTLRGELEKQNKTLARMHAAQATRDKAMATSARLAGAGAKAMAAGAAIGLPAAMAIKDYATFEEAMLGVARQVEGARDANGKLTATYYDMGRAIKEMSERIPMATVELAKLVEAGARMGIQGKENLILYAKTAATMADAFELPVEKVGEDMARIADLFKMPIASIAEIGDAINFLDDNAKSKGGDIIDVMQRIAGTAQMVNMNFREAAALGSTFLTLGAGPEVAATASTAMIRELSIATMQTKRFRGGLEMLKLDAKSIQFGMNKDATGTIIKVLEAIKALPQEKQLEAATRLFGKEFGDDASKLAQNLGEYRKQLEMVNAEAAKGSMQREADARKEIINARLLMAKNAMFNLSSDLGDHLKPALIETLERTLAIVQGVRAWAQENPGLAAGLMTAAKSLALVVTGIGALLLVAAAVLGPLAMLKFSLTTLGVSGAGVGALAGQLGSLLPTLTGIRAAAQKLGGTLADAWRAAAPRVGGPSVWQRLKDTLERTSTAAKQALHSSRAWASGLSADAKTHLSAARIAVADYTRQVWASIAATRAAAAAKLAATVGHVRTRGATGLAADAGMGVWNLLKGGTRAALGGISGALSGVGHALTFIARAALMNPIGLVITGIAAAALLVVKYWQPIKAFFGGFWDGLKEGLAPLSGMFDAMGSAMAPLKPVWDWMSDGLGHVFAWVSKLFQPFQSTGDELAAATQKGKGFGLWLGELVVTVADMVGKFFGFGANIIGGLIDGIVSKWDSLKALVGKLGQMLPDWLRKPLDMHSPSRVFAELGGFTMAGLEQGILVGADGPLGAIMSTAKRLAAAGAGVMIGGAAMAGDLPRIDTRGPMAPAAAMAGAAAPMIVQITINAAPGMDEQAIARQVGIELQRIESQRAARGRSRLTDSE